MDQHASTARRLPLWGFFLLLAGYLAVLQVLGVLLTRGLDVQYAAPTTITELWRGITVPVGVSLLLVVAAITALRWWRPVLVEDHPVRSWVIVVPVVQFAAIAAATNYGGLAERGLGFTLLLLCSTLFVGFGEELMFRGIGVTVFRHNGFSEGRVALWSTVTFGLAHATNLINTGFGALAQVLLAAVSGYFFYLVRRRSGGILLPAVVHGLWDFSLISGAVVPGESYFGVVASLLAIIGLAVVLVVRRHRIHDDRRARTAAGPSDD
ncbi:CPBP family intramembrane glutamic endopeptidase [Amycolatopsis sp. 195334CR]|uniref:CPBP family intramembrane glutamic endopeptidase n=1 Tax=Amycolatopsis sp. 195334CR TaxID=2814588 RepID=UPI001A8D4BB2|nr:CPBP family intramembrane glutamic endopeptidase [Amycolatopsis sp. 195334CR]MBN6038172.1 CPBP family intramembrane metalloprotease [Amycolatopsis sp. 195334CR]